MTTSRIVKKRVDRAVCAGLALPTVIAHAKPSFWLLQAGTQRTYLQRTMVKELREHPRHAWWAVRDWCRVKRATR